MYTVNFQLMASGQISVLKKDLRRGISLRRLTRKRSLDCCLFVVCLFFVVVVVGGGGVGVELFNEGDSVFIWFLLLFVCYLGFGHFHFTFLL